MWLIPLAVTPADHYLNEIVDRTNYDGSLNLRHGGTVEPIHFGEMVEFAAALSPVDIALFSATYRQVFGRDQAVFS